MLHDRKNVKIITVAEKNKCLFKMLICEKKKSETCSGWNHRSTHTYS